MINGVFYINFKVTGFDDDPMTSLIIECGKEECINQEKAHDILNLTKENYNRYAYSLLKDKQVVSVLEKKTITKPQFSS